MPSHVRVLRVFTLAAAATIVVAAASASQEPLFSGTPTPRTPARLTIAMIADAAAIAPGSPLTLHLEMAPAPGIHVYAPGNPDYIPLSVTLAPVAGVQFQPAVYPPGEDYRFGELKETVKVYSRPFDVRQQITVTRAGAKAAGRSITIAGSVRYQACDDKVCFPPATAPVSITLPIASSPAARRSAARP